MLNRCFILHDYCSYERLLVSVLVAMELNHPVRISPNCYYPTYNNTEQPRLQMH